MLSTPEIAHALSLSEGDAKKLTIVPQPDLDDLRDRAGASVDLRLGRWFRSFKQSQYSSIPLSLRASTPEILSDIEGSRTKQHFVPFGEPFVLHPSRFVLGVTLEWLRLPATLSGYVTGKSTLGRHGLVIETAAGIHPNFSGCLTLELANVGEVPIEISPGMKICQIFLHEVQKSEGKDKGSMYGQRKPSAPPPNVDPIFESICVSD